MVNSKLTPEERLIKKRQAARLRQQRCRQRKRERAAAAAALAKGIPVGGQGVKGGSVGSSHQGLAHASSAADAGPNMAGPLIAPAPAEHGPHFEDHYYKDHSNAQYQAAYPGRHPPQFPSAVSASSSTSFEAADAHHAQYAAAAAAQAAAHGYPRGYGAPIAPISPSPPTAMAHAMLSRRSPVPPVGSGYGYTAGAPISGASSNAPPRSSPPGSSPSALQEKAEFEVAVKQEAEGPSKHGEAPESQGKGKVKGQKGTQEKEAVDAILALAGPGPNGTPPMPPLDSPAPLAAGERRASRPSSAPGLGPPPPPPPLPPPAGMHQPPSQRWRPYEYERGYSAPPPGPPGYPEDEPYPYLGSQSRYPHPPQGAAPRDPASTAPPAASDTDHDFLLREDRLREEMLALKAAEHRLAQQQHELEQRRYRHDLEARERRRQVDVQHQHQAHLGKLESVEREYMPPPPAPSKPGPNTPGAVMGRGRVTHRPAPQGPGFYMYTRAPQQV
eukprot:CAMPEP_0113534626 /NCGR_PEP_ID=MMETSP0015_2-20120614/5260_1 /TAXON_ID=2838 /ORGANISM="Odontella" /LENGTH=499 /DNA_ID=CAMNT_0000433801 /DNA_START=439 /DNA_END=1938 /DNA_ORIENTATION=- /assembly_acc=CAM_ASM_000160